jgi:hypothetical protein
MRMPSHGGRIYHAVVEAANFLPVEVPSFSVYGIMIA